MDTPQSAEHPQRDPVAVETIRFPSGEATLVGHLYRPSDLGAKRAPVVVVTGAWTTIKEHMAGDYARKLAERGVPALAFDFRTWGESGGSTRSLEDPQRKIEDILAAVSALKARDDVSDVHGLGICASAGYMATAAERSAELTRLALVAPWLHDAQIVSEVYGGDEGVAALIAKGREAEQAEASTHTPTLIPAAGPEGSDALMAFEGYYTDPQRGGLATWQNTFNVASWEPWLTFDAQRAAPGIRQPTLLVHSEQAAIPQGAHAFYAALTAPKRQVWVAGATQFDFYDQPNGVEPALDAVIDHFSGQQANPDEAAIRTAMTLVGTLVDRGDYDALARVFADEVRLDYTSLWGGEVSTLPRAGVIAAWSGLVPGFDRTYHDLGRAVIKLEGDRAEARASVKATHWLGGQTWVVAGHYRNTFAKNPATQSWELSGIEFMLEREEGERSLVEEAQARAAGK